MRIHGKDDEVWDLIQRTLSRYLADPGLLPSTASALEALVPSEQAESLTNLLSGSRLSYRDVTLIQLAYALCAPGLDTNERPPGARTTGSRLGTFFASRHVPAVDNGYQNIGKNSTRLTRGNVAEFDGFLGWAATASTGQIQACLDFACATIAATARPMASMPDLDVGRLTFAGVMRIQNRLLTTPSEGAHEQYLVASLIEAIIEQNALDKQYRVQTKKLNTTDASSSVAGDIQVMTGNRVLEAYEVTANDWRTKVDGIGQKVRTHDLSRIHIVAGGRIDGDSVVGGLAGVPEDVSVLGLEAVCSVILSALTRQYRAAALRRLYELLDRYAGSARLVNDYVNMLHECELTLLTSKVGTDG